ncbi:MaoC family dehydratase [Nocardioides nitrophenolicus]|uniref:MaoC family dehydratase n=1 Tax=Nocardioides nitrophenolicus TaxID=60489 RepID=UPI00195AE722|nr:MaoC family dehydratase [Nocardioides nitrophenolicus]MBM7518497.1 acyl dehydratase [Nocardioides nitrophenolicus]
MTIVFAGPAAFAAAGGTDLGSGPWLTITQERIDAFADVTEDWQWIHTDPERAADSDLGSTIAHGYLTLSLVPRLSSGIFDFTDIGRAVNYGIERVRFPAPVRPGDRIRARAALVETSAAGPDGAGVLGRVRYTIDIEDAERPACVLDALMLVLPAETTRAED